jgi:hypothetical protein
MGVCLNYHYHKEKLNDLELLLELQHYGAATGLVDFSRDFLIALWFAAHGNKGKNGKIQGHLIFLYGNGNFWHP